RNDFQVKIRGFRIELGEIEAQLAACAGVREGVVLAREDQPGDKRLVAYLIAQEGVELIAAELRQQLSESLADYMLPSAFVTLASFPLTPNGKLDRKALPAPDQSAVVSRQYVAPEGEVEQAIATIWQDLLGLERVGRHDQFFELGGHSLLAVQLVSRLRQVLGVELPLRELFAQPTLQGLAQSVQAATHSTHVAMPLADRSQPLPLSWAQQRLWFLNQLDANAGVAYHMPAGLRLQGQLDRAALRATLDRIVARHEALRTCFVLDGGGAVQVIAPTGIGFSLREHDLRQQHGQAQHDTVQRLAAAEASAPFDLATGPLIRGQLLQLAEDEHLLLITQHHIISDGWSIGVLVREVSALYTAFSQGQIDPLLPLTIQYADYAAWQRQWLQGDTLQTQVDFWQQHLTGAPALLDLPTDRPRPAVQSYAGGQVALSLSPTLTAGLKQLSQRHGTTLFITLLAGWSVLLSRWSGQDDVVIGTPVANRQRSELEGLMGFFVNTLALRVKLNDNPNVQTLLAQTKASTIAAYAHQDLPFEQVVEALQPTRSLSHSPLFQVMLVLNNIPVGGELSLPGLTLSEVEQARDTAQFDLTLSLGEDGDALTGNLEYASDLFDRSTIERLVGHLHTVLAGMVANDQQAISHLPLLSAAERQQVLVDFNATTVDYPADAQIHQLFERQAEQQPDAIAVVFENQQLSYRELNARANQLAHQLIGLGVQPDDRVALCVERSLDLVIGLLGILKAGGAYVPLDPSYPAERLAYMLSDSQPVALVTQQALQERLPLTALPVLALDGPDGAAMLARQADHNPDAAALGLNSNHLAYVIYTSGSTGQPKGVANTIAGLRNRLQWFGQLLSQDKPVTALKTSIGFVDSVTEITETLVLGGRLVVLDNATVLDHAQFAACFAKHQITNLTVVPALLRVLLGMSASALASLRTLVCSGELLPAELSQRFKQAHPRVRLFNFYGSSEVNGDCTALEYADQFDAAGSSRSVIGRPIANTRIYLLDTHGQPVPIGVNGELYVGGAGIARGYLNRPDLTAERFIADPFNADPQARMYKTGDLGRWLPDGHIEYLGRNDFQVKIRGFRIELGEIEAQLTACVGVREAVVIAREDQPGDQRLVAYLIPQDGIELSAADLRQQLSQSLADYMLPSAFVTLDAFPRTPNGKLDRKALPAPDQSAVVSREYVAPQGEIETIIATIWQDLLGLERVGRHDQFFELGGHSLLAVQLVSRLRASLNIELTLRELFAQPTVSGLAELAAQAAQTDAAPIPLADRSQPLPLSWSQQRLWFLDQLDTNAGAAYHLPIALRLRGQLDITALRAALDQLIARHDSLRTTFTPTDGEPVQHIAAADIGFALSEQDWGALPADAQPAAIDQLIAAESSAPFDLTHGPLIRGQLIRLGDGDYLLLINQHHIVSDAWSIGVLVREVSALYTAFAQGQPDLLPALPLQYADYAVWQRQWLQGEVLQSQRDFWRDHLLGAPALLELPTDRPRPAVQSYRGSALALALPPALTARLRQLSQRHGTTLFMTLLAGWSVLLSRLSGQDDVVIGTPVANRPRTELEGLIGFFVNTLALRVKLDANPGVGELLAQVKASTLAAYSHRDLPFEQVVDVLQPPRSLSHSPLFQSLFTLNNTPQGQALGLPGLTLQVLETPHHTTQFDLSLSLQEDDAALSGRLEYATDLFDAETIARLAGHFETVLAGMVENDRQAVSRLPLLTAAQRQQLIHDFNATTANYPVEPLIHQLFEAQAAAQPASTALIFEGQTLSYGELNARANQLAHHLIQLGVQPDDRVALCLERSLDLVVSLLGILKAGGAYVPLDPTYPVERLAYMLVDSQPVALITQADLRTVLPTAAVPVVVVDAEPRCAAQPSTNPVVAGLSPRHLAYVIYTSGSTGLPKGVMNQHDGVVNRLLWAQDTYRLLADDRVLQKTPFGFDVSVWEFFLPLLAGAQLVLARPNGHQDPHYLAGLIETAGITTLHFVPSMLHVFLDQVPSLRGSALRRVLCSGEALPHALQQRFHARFAEVELHNLYGPTEAAIDVTACQCRPDAFAGIVPIGKPIANIQLYILDAQGQPVPLGVAGELHIGGIGVARGYLNRPELTAERFIADPFSSDVSARLYKTGDLGRWLPDGNIEYLGRNDFQVKIRGLRIELGEIEARLAACAGVREVVVLAREDVPGDKRLVAYLVAQDGITLSTAELRQQLSDSLADYMLPSAFVTLDAFPLTPNGKLDRKALPAPDQTAVISRAYEAPRGEVEQTIAAIWQDLLGLERIGRHDQFFELGGHSLLAVQLVSRLRAALGVALSLRELFAQPTVLGLAGLVAQTTQSTQAAIPLADRSQPLPLSWSQQRLWFLDQLDANAGAAYHMPAGLQLLGQLDRAALLAALDRIVARHEALRTRFPSVAGQPVQVIAPADTGFSLAEHDLRSLHGQAQQDAVQRLAANASEPFDLAHGPLIRGQLLQLADDDHLLLINQHHIISDGWSIGVLVREVSALYAAFSQGQADPLPPLTIQYADYAVWQRQWLQGEVLQNQRDFWRDHLLGAPALLELPTDRPRPATQSYAGGQVSLTLPAALTAKLRQLSQRHGATLFMSLLAGWSVLLSRLSGQDDVVIGTPVANRPRSELEGLMGFFVNTLALRVRLDSNPGVGELLSQIKASTLAAYDHQDLPFEQVVDALQPPRSLSHSPLFQVMLVLNNTPGGGELHLPGLTLCELPQAQDTAQFDVTLSLSETGDGLVGTLAYASDLFERATIERLAGQFETVLAGMVANDQQGIAQLPLLRATERQQLADFNATAADYPADALIHQLFEQQAEQQPDAIALLFEDQRLSYGELNCRANKLAHHLITLGIQPDDRVAICVERSLAMVVGLLAILKAGAAYVPLDPNYPAERLAYMLSDSQPVALVTQASPLATLPMVDVPVVVLDEESTLAAQSTANPVIAGLTAAQLAYVIYTSGSTGQPKGVAMPQRAVLNLLHWHFQHPDLCAGDKTLQFAALGFDVAFQEIFTTLCAGHCLVLLDELTRQDPIGLARFIRDQRIERIYLPFVALQGLAEAAAALEGGLPSLNNVITAGEQLRISPAIRQLIETAAPCRLHNHYGPTESHVVTAFTLSDVPNDWATLPPIGRPIANSQIYLLDPHGQPVPLGVAGELYIGGVGVARGYLNRPELTTERFVADPFSADPQARMYKTGDLARWLPDGNIEYLGRNDFQVKIRGFRVELGEVEAQLAACAGVREVVVMAREDQPGDKRLVAYVIPQEGADPSAADLRQQLSQSLADYMLPSAFVTLETFPLTPNGKLDRKALPAPDQSSVISREYEAPQGEVEQTIAAIWQDLLGLERVGRHDQFFELGGHSLMVVTLIEQLRQRGLIADVRTVFTTPTLAAMAEVITAGQAGSASTSLVPPNLIPADCTTITPAMLPLVNLTQTEIDTLVASVPHGAANVQDIYPLGPLQEGILFHHLLETEGDAYLLRVVVGFDQRSRLDAFLSALQQVIDRHDILRTSARWHSLAQAVQVVYRQAPLPIEELVLSPEIDARQQLLDRTNPRQLRLDLMRSPLLTAYIAHDPHSGEWLLSLLNHHLTCDHVSLEFVIREVQAILQGQGDLLPPAMPYRNFIAQTLSVPPEVHEAYFREQLGDVDEPTAPFGLLDVHGAGDRIVEAHLVLRDTLAQGIRERARQRGMTPSVLFHVAWAQVVAQCSGRDDVVFGTVLSGRLQGTAGADQVLGMFINTLPIRVPLAELSVEQVVRETYQRLTDLLTHEQTPLALALRCSGVPAPLPLFSALLNYRHSAASAARPDEATARAWEGMQVLVAEERTNYPMTLSVDDLGQDFVLTAQGIQGIDAARIAGYMHTAIAGLVEALTEQPDQPIRAQAILPAAERQQVLVDFNATAADYPADALIHHLFEAHAAQQPDAVALVFEEQELSYNELNCRANQLAHHLIALGIQPDDRVAICVERSLDLVIGLLGILKAGGVYVPLDPAYPAERLAYMLRDSQPAVVLTQAALRDGLPLGALPVWVLDGTDLAVQPAANPLVAGLTAEHLAYVIYTSGSTGQPKGVMNHHRGLCNLIPAHIQTFAIRPDSHLLQFASCSFDASIWEMMLALCAGAALHMVRQRTALAGAALRDTLLQAGISHAILSPAALSSLPQDETLGAVHTLITGGEALPPALARHWAQQHRLFNAYGPTEITVCATVYDYQWREHGTVPIGRPIANTQIYLLDAHGQPVPIGVAGEIYIGGAGVARGYLNRPDLTAERFVADPFSTDPQARLYKTGDLGRWLPDGNIDYLGRNDFQVKIRGFRIELGEIEAKLAACVGVREAVVIAREDQPGGKRLVAYVVPQDGIELAVAELREQLSQYLADYMLPSAFVTLEAFPLTPNGKLDRKALPAPDQSSVISRSYEAPQGEVEQAIATIWQDLLGLERVGRYDQFFELGGHSLLAVQLVSRLRANLGVEIALRELFAQPTVIGLAALVAQATQSSQTLIPPTDRSQPLPLSWAQQRLWFLNQLDANAGAAYHMPAGLRLHGQLDRAALRATLDRIVARHEVLRTCFISDSGEAVQVIASAEIGFSLREHDLRAFSTQDQQRKVEQLSQAEAIAPFDLSTGPLIRGQLLQLANDEHLLLITQHHIISDGWSIGVLVREVSALYTAFSQGQADPLAPLAIQYADYAAWQRQWLQGDPLQTQVDFWHDHLAGAPALLDLPTDRPRPTVQSYAGGQVALSLSPALTNSLKQLSQRHGTTLFMTLLAGWSVLLSRWSGQDDVVIGTPVANRQRSELEGLMGFFVNTLALRVKLDGNPKVDELLNQIKTNTIAAYAHQDLPFEQVVEALQPTRSLSHSPVFQVMLTLNNTPTGGELSLPGLTLSPVEQTSTTTQFDLSLSLTDTATGLVGSLAYARDLFDAQTIERLAGHFEAVLTGMVADDQQGTAQLPLLSAAERQQVLVDFNATQTDYPHDQLIHRLFEQRAEHQPDASALIFEDQTLSYGELNRRANQLAHQLIQLGIRPDDRVALCIERSLDMIVGLLGILKAGGAYVPLDPGYPAERLAYMLADSQPVAVVTQVSLRETLPALDVPVVALDAEAALVNQATSNPLVAGLTSRHLAYVIYTSGSTGQPKGVMVEHHSAINLWAALEAAAFQHLLTSARVALNANLVFDASLQALLQLLSGRGLVLIPADVRSDGIALWRYLSRHAVDALDCTPTQLGLFLSAGLLDGAGYQPKLLLIGGEAITPTLWRYVQSLTAVRCYNVYGPTECTVDATAVCINDAGALPQIGRPLANTRIHVLDPHGQPVPIGVAGEMYIGGAGVARGYLNRPALTTERFLADPTARLYKTGDLGRWLPDGNLEYLGRNDFQVKIRGFRIELGEIEAKLTACAGVREAVVMAREDVQGDKRLVAYLIAQEGIELSAAELRQQLSQSLADYMLPSAFVSLDAFPLTSNGKLDRKALPAPDQSSVVTQAYEAPQGEVEAMIAALWQDLLGLERIGRHDHFFELGGHSLMVVTLIERLRQQGLFTDVRTVFTAPTLATFSAALLEAQDRATKELLVPANLIPAEFGASVFGNDNIEEFEL
uniref:non-ribosomal peptide synthetase n=1 Tax=Andreprevotia chitinilytica TaxID=396808 RepID=UPI00068B5399